MMSRKALAAGFERENVAYFYRRRAPCRSKLVASGLVSRG